MEERFDLIENFAEDSLDLSILNSGSLHCNFHKRIIPGVFSEHRKLRSLHCEKCLRYKNKKIREGNYTIPIRIATSEEAWLGTRRGKTLFLDDFSYRILASWIASSVCDGIVEILDVWRCSEVRNIAEEACEPYDDSYKDELEIQRPQILSDLRKIEFRSRPLEEKDFFVRRVAFSYLHEDGTARSGDVKICLKVPCESSFVFNDIEVHSLSSI